MPEIESLFEEMGYGVAYKHPAKVYKDRLTRCRKLMEAKGIDALLIYSGQMEGLGREWARYFFNHAFPYWCGDAFVLIPMDGEPVLSLNFPFMLELAALASPFKDIRTHVGRFQNESTYGGMARFLGDLLKEKKLQRAKIGICIAGQQGPYIHFEIYEAMKRGCKGAKIVDATQLLFDLIEQKTDYDIAMIEDTCRVGDAGMKAALEAVEEGQREYETYLAYQRAVMDLGGETPLWHYVMASGPSCEFPLRPFSGTGRKIRKGDFVMIDAAVCYKGYYIDHTRTAVVGPPSPEQRRLFDATRETLDAMVDVSKVGTKCSEIGNALLKTVKRNGYEKIHPLMGHGTGIMANEPPYIMPWNPFPLKKDMAINFEPAIYVPKLGGVRIEDPYLVTTKGLRRLTKLDQGLYIA